MPRELRERSLKVDGPSRRDPTKRRLKRPCLSGWLRTAPPVVVRARRRRPSVSRGSVGRSHLNGRTSPSVNERCATRQAGSRKSSLSLKGG